MSLKKQLKEQAAVHPLDIDTEMFHKAVTRIEVLESALIQVTKANPNWAKPMPVYAKEAIQHIIDNAKQSQ